MDGDSSIELGDIVSDPGCWDDRVSRGSGRRRDGGSRDGART